MPTLNWIGKKAVVKHHKDVPYRLLELVPELSCGDSQSGNLIVQGDNLHALKALLPRYAGKVKCIYIDPPYNTGNEGWVYNDNVNSPEIRKWLGAVVGKEGETLDRHDRWLCMMYPRLVLLREFLSADGAIFVSIDDNEQANLKLLMDEVFGANNFISNVIWQKKHSPQGDATYFSTMHDYLFIFAKKSKNNKNDPNGFSLAKLERTDIQNSRYQNPDNDPRGNWTSDNYTCNKNSDERPNLYYPILNPNTHKEIWPSKTSVWRYSQERHNENINNNLVVWGSDGKGRPRFKRFIDKVSGVVPSTWWTREFAGDNQEARKELRKIFSEDEVDFTTPKPTQLIERILQMTTDKDSLILDSFAGSGTTAHAVLNLNKQDGGNRKFILVEMDETIAKTVTAERNKRVIEGYNNAKGEKIEGLGGGFQFCRLSKDPLFTADGQVRSDVSFAQLAEFVWFKETGTGYAGKGDSPLLGVFDNRAVYLLYNGILKDKTVNGGNVLTPAIFKTLPGFDGSKIIYAAAVKGGASWIADEQITFKQTPYALEL